MLLALANEPIEWRYTEQEWLLDVLRDHASADMPNTFRQLRARLLQIVPEPDHDIVAEVMGQLQDADPVRHGTLVLQLITDAGIPIAPAQLLQIWDDDPHAGFAPALEVTILLLASVLPPQVLAEGLWMTADVEGGEERPDGPEGPGEREKLLWVRDPLLRPFSHRRPVPYDCDGLPPLPQRFEPLLYSLDADLERSVRQQLRVLLFKLLERIDVPEVLQQLDQALRHLVPVAHHALVDEVMADLGSDDRVRAGTMALHLVIDAGLPVSCHEMERMMYRNQPEELAWTFDSAMEILLARIPDGHSQLGYLLGCQIAGGDAIAPG